MNKYVLFGAMISLTAIMGGGPLLADTFNVALGKPVTASPFFLPGYPPEFAVDGDDETCWDADNDYAFFEIDFEGGYLIYRVEFNPGITTLDFGFSVDFFVENEWVHMASGGFYAVDGEWFSYNPWGDEFLVSKIRLTFHTWDSGLSIRMREIAVLAIVVNTVEADLSCTPTIATLPFSLHLGVIMDSLVDNYRTFAGGIDVTLASGALFTNYRAGYMNLLPLEHREIEWDQNIPAFGTLVGDNIFTLHVQDVTPPPYNQPPFWPSGDIDTDGCTVTGIAP